MPEADVPAAPFGYHGAYLRIDVSNSQVHRVPIAEAVLRQFIGGAGLGAWLMLEEGAANADAFAPEAPIAFVFSPLVGSPLTTSAKFAVVSKSPLTDRINDSLASSGFAITGKKTGHDAIVLTGNAPRPSILVIDDDAVSFEPAGPIWGLENHEAQQKLRERLGADFQVATIGPAGERTGRFATTSHD